MYRETVQNSINDIIFRINAPSPIHPYHPNGILSHLQNQRTSMEITFIIGSCAAVATTISFLPQAVKVITTRDTRSISLLMYIIFSLGLGLWLTYGILRNDIPVITANAVTLVFTLIILFYKITERK